MGLCLLSLDVTGTGAMVVPSWQKGRNCLNCLGFALVHGGNGVAALLHIETV